MFAKRTLNYYNRKEVFMLRLALIFTFISVCCSVSAQHVSTRDNYYRQLNEKYTSALFRSDDAFILVPMDDKTAGSYLTLFSYLQGKIAGLQIYTVGFAAYVSYRQAKTAFFLDEMPVDAGELSSVSMEDIAMIKVFRPTFIGAIGGGPGGA